MADTDLPVFSFLPNWQRGVTETLEWLTDVLRSGISGHEQRRSIRLTPRRYFEARFNPFDETRSFMDLWLQRFGAQEFLLPLWHDRAKLSAGAAETDTRLEFDNTFREFEDGGLAILRRDLFLYEVVEIAAQDDTGIDLAAPLASDWLAGSVVYPLRPAQLDNLQAVLTSLTRRVGQTQLAFRLTRENPYPLGDETLTTHEGFPVVLLEPNRRDDLESRFEQMYVESDFGSGTVYRRSETARAFAAQFYDWQARGRQQHHELRQTLYRLNGRQKAVWMPSFNKDITLARPVTAASGHLNIRQIGYRYLGGPIAGRDRILLKDDAGAVRIVRVTDTGIPLATGEDRLVLSGAAGFEAAAGREGSFIDLVRMDQDRVEITHYTDSEGACEAAAAFRSFAQGRTTEGVLVQPYPEAAQTPGTCGIPADDEFSPCLAYDPPGHKFAFSNLPTMNSDNRFISGNPSRDPGVGPLTNANHGNIQLDFNVLGPGSSTELLEIDSTQLAGIGAECVNQWANHASGKFQYYWRTIDQTLFIQFFPTFSMNVSSLELILCGNEDNGGTGSNVEHYIDGVLVPWASVLLNSTHSGSGVHGVIVDLVPPTGPDWISRLHFFRG